MSNPGFSAEDSRIDAAESTLNSAIEAIAGVPIPKPVKQNAWKAFGRLCSAVIEVPTSYFEGIVAEKRAIAEARVKLIETNATKIADQIKVDEEYARVAVRRYGRKIVREQVNLDLISEEAARQLKELDDYQTSSEVGQIDDDWLNHFEKEASQRSTEDMQKVFGKILAGEIRRPSSYSIKAVKIMGELDKVVADLFTKLSSFCCVFGDPESGMIFDARAITFTENTEGNALRKYGLGFGELNVLQEYGLIIADYNSWMDYEDSTPGERSAPLLGLSYQNEFFELFPMERRRPPRKLRLHGVTLSYAGRELLNVVDIAPIDSYSSDLVDFFAQKGLKMVPSPK